MIMTILKSRRLPLDHIRNPENLTPYGLVSYQQETKVDKRWGYSWSLYQTLYRLIEYMEALKKLEMSKIYTKDDLVESKKPSNFQRTNQNQDTDGDKKDKDDRREENIYKTLHAPEFRKSYSKFKQALHKCRRETDNKLNMLVQRLQNFFNAVDKS